MGAHGPMGMLASGALWSCAGALLSCAGALEEPAPQPGEAALHDATGAPVIATLKTKDAAVAITSAAGHVRYALPSAAGGETSLTIEQLQSYDPDLYELVRHATAAGAARGTAPLLDARFVAEPELDASRGGRAGPRVR